MPEKDSVFSRFRKYFLSGLVVFLPVALSVYLFVWILNFADSLFGAFLESYFVDQVGFYFRGLSFLVGVYLITVIGFLATNFFGKKIHSAFESLILRLPFFRQVYPTIKEVALFLFSRDKLAFKQVVIIEYPRKGIYSFAFLTNEASTRINDLTGQELCNVFVPSAPGPVTGFVVMVPRKDIIFTELTVEDTVRVIVSGGVVNPYL